MSETIAAMSVAPSPHEHLSLQPYYFTSSLFVVAFREDIKTLIHAFYEVYSQSSTRPFAIFKHIWGLQSWDWMQFKVFDPRSRETFLNTALRLFLERTVRTEAPFTRVVALFGLYTFFNTQPSVSSPPLHSVKSIPIPYDQYPLLLSLADSLNSEGLKPLRPSVCYILDRMVKSNTFLILPASDKGPCNPRSLPREIYLDQNTISLQEVSKDTNAATGSQKKAGRPTKRDQVKKATAALEDVDQWVHSIAHAQNNDLLPPQTSLQMYQYNKAQLLLAMETPDGLEAIDNTSLKVLERMEQTLELMDETGEAGGSSLSSGIERLQTEMGDQRRLLGLVKETTWQQ